MAHSHRKSGDTTDEGMVEWKDGKMNVMYRSSCEAAGAVALARVACEEHRSLVVFAIALVGMRMIMHN